MPRPAAAPNASNGAPMPIASRNSAAPPSTGSWLWPMYSTAPASGGATHGPTISADNAPIAATPASEPPRWRSVSAPSRERSAIGSCSSYRPNDDSASATNSAREGGDDPRVLERRLQVGAEQPGDDAGDGEHQRVGDHVDQRQHQRAPRAQARALAGDQARQDRDHRQHARRERQQQAGAEEAEQRQPAIACRQGRRRGGCLPTASVSQRRRNDSRPSRSVAGATRVCEPGSPRSRRGRDSVAFAATAARSSRPPATAARRCASSADSRCRRSGSPGTSRSSVMSAASRVCAAAAAAARRPGRNRRRRCRSARRDGHARRPARRARRDAARRRHSLQRRLVAIQVIALRRGEAQQQRVAVVDDRLEAERLLRRQRLRVHAASRRPATARDRAERALPQARRSPSSPRTAARWRRGSATVRRARLRRIAHADVGAALVLHLQRDGVAPVARAGQRCAAAAGDRFRRRRRTRRGAARRAAAAAAAHWNAAIGLHADPVPVQVIAVGDAPAQRDAVARRRLARSARRPGRPAAGRPRRPPAPGRRRPTHANRAANARRNHGRHRVQSPLRVGSSDRAFPATQSR